MSDPQTSKPVKVAIALIIVTIIAMLLSFAALVIVATWAAITALF